MFGKVSQFEWISLASLTLVAWIFPRIGDKWFRAIEKSLGQFARRKSSAVWTTAILAIVLRLLLLPVLHIPVPGIHDEFSYLLAGDTFAHGRLANPPPAMSQSFASFHINVYPTYASIFPPGQGFVLAIGQFIGHPWIGVLLSVGAMCAAICWMLQGWMPAEWAFLGAMLAVLRFAPFSYWMNSYWGGALAAIGGALVMGAVPRIYRRQRMADAFILATGLGILANTRPFEGFVFSVPIAIALLLWLASKSSPPLSTSVRTVILPIGFVLTATVLWIGYYNWRVTEHALLFPHMLNFRTYHSEPLFLWQHHTPALVYNNTQFDAFYNKWSRSQYHFSWNDVWRVTTDKFQNFWAVFLGPYIILPAVMLPWVMRAKRTSLLLIVFIVTWAAFFCLTWSLPHYVAPLTGVTFALTAQGFRHLRTVRFEGRRVGVAWCRISAAMVFITFSVCLAILSHKPWAPACACFRGDIDRANLSKQLMQMPGAHLVLVRYSQRHYIHKEWVYNPADLNFSKVIWARELGGEQDEKLLEHYRDRRIWSVEPDSESPKLVPYVRLIAESRLQLDHRH